MSSKPSTLPRPVATTSIPSKRERGPRKEKPPRPHKVERTDLEVANRTSDYFLGMFYDRFDAPRRDGALLKLYRDDTKLTWNGNMMKGVHEIKEFFATLPKSHHSIQSWDCHPVPGVDPAPILVTVSGSVTHGGKPEKGFTNKVVESLPRIFHHSFVLAPSINPSVAPSATDPASEEVQGENPLYYIVAETYRFVG